MPPSRLIAPRLLSLAFVLFISATRLHAYSVLSHEAMVDALWDVRIKAILLSHYPNATPDELKKAHGYAYGGAIIQDLGYYPPAAHNSAISLTTSAPAISFWRS